MSDDGYQVNTEPQSNAGKWILIVLAILVVAGFGYAHYTTHKSVEALTQDLAASQAQVKELQNRMQSAEAQEETLAQQAGMTKRNWRGVPLSCKSQQRTAETRLEKERARAESAD